MDDSSGDLPDFSRLLNKIHLGKTPDFLQNIPPDTIALTLTSPPYYDDELYILDNDELEFGWRTYDDYLNHIFDTLDKIYEITIPSGHCVLVLSNTPQTREEEYVSHYWPIIHDVVNYATQNSWEMTDEIIWVKKEDNYPYMKSHNTPETTSRVKHDIITVLRKTGPLRKGEHKSHISSVWHLAARGKYDSYNKVYPSFPKELARRVIDSWSLPDDIVLDPYAGSGQVCRIAMEMDRFAIGIEYDEKWLGLWEDISGEK